MKHISPGIRLTLFLLLFCTLLGGLLVHQWRTALQLTTGASTQATEDAGSSQPDMVTYTAPSIAAFGEILERPLFTPGREPPPEPEQTPAPQVPTTPLRLQLEGVAINAAARVAVVRDLSNNKLIRIAEGDKHQGWLIERVHPAGATFRRGDETRELALKPEEETRKRRK